MEVGGLVVGGVALAGLYSACVEAVERVESYRNFEEDAQHLLTRFKASKVILQRWASQVGLLDGRLRTTTIHSSMITALRRQFAMSWFASTKSWMLAIRWYLGTPWKLTETPENSDSRDKP
jgi:Prion-inhibition and propagation